MFTEEEEEDDSFLELAQLSLAFLLCVLPRRLLLLHAKSLLLEICIAAVSSFTCSFSISFLFSEQQPKRAWSVGQTLAFLSHFRAFVRTGI